MHHNDVLLVVGRPRKKAIDDTLTYLREDMGIEPTLIHVDYKKITGMLQTMAVDFGLELFDPETALELEPDGTFSPDEQVEVLCASNAVQLAEAFREVVGVCPEDTVAVLWTASDSPTDPVDFGILDDVIHVQVLANGRLMFSMPEDSQGA